jgi:hypothetical protein
MSSLIVVTPGTFIEPGLDVVSIHDASLRMVMTIPLDTRTAVAPGLYLVRVPLPDGSRAERLVNLGAGEHAEVSITAGDDPPPWPPSGDPIGPEPGLGVQRWSLRLRSARTGETLEAPWAAKVLQRRPDDRIRGAEVLLSVQDVREPLLAQVAAVGSPVWNICLPFRHDTEKGAPYECRLRVSFVDGDLRAGALLNGGSAVDFIARAMVTGQFRAASRLAERATALLYAKRADPVAAALGAYALLRVGKQPPPGWVANLAHGFPWLPDGAVLHGVAADRDGRPEAAARCFDESLSRGLPLFSDGLAFLASHLRARSDRSKLKHEGPKPRQRSRAARALAIAPLADASQLLVSYPGGHPMRPDRSLWDRQLVTSRGWKVFA